MQVVFASQYAPDDMLAFSGVPRFMRSLSAKELCDVRRACADSRSSESIGNAKGSRWPTKC